jgi:hypothetical protein
VLPCKNAFPSGSPETVNTAVALQLESKTWVLVVGDGIVIAGGGRFFTGTGTAFTRVLVLEVLVLTAGVRGGGAGTAAGR